MASSSSATASSLSFSSSERRQKRYDVFISFRGEDTRNNFISHLYAAFRRKSIETYIDDRLHRGDVISEALMKAIEDSFVSLIVFSENYASSKWCLDELTKIVECKRFEEQVVMPVFYKIDPSHVRKQLGSFKIALAGHEKVLKNNKDKVLKWKAALTEAANLAGYDSRNFRTDNELVEQIVKEVMQKLNHMYPIKLRHLVGVEQSCVTIESMLTNNPSKVQIVGIWGMGGMGKTTLAALLFAKLSFEYEGKCFLENVRTESKKHGLNFLRNKLLSGLLEEDIHICTPQVTSSFALSRLNRRRSFIVLDDVNNSEQLEYLVGGRDCLGSGSTVIVTSRDRDVLSGGVDEIYEVSKLSDEDSLQLFSLNAFNKSNPEMQFKEQSMSVVHYAKGIPLALKVLGSFFRSKSRKKEWDSALKKLQKIPNREIQDVLRLSYDELDDKEQDIFLDIACFLKGWHKDDVTRLLEGCNFYPDIGIKNLEDKALITISDENRIEMHDLIQEMGWEIVRQESTKEPGNRSRLWDLEEVFHVLKNNRGTDAIEGIVLNAYQYRDLYLASDVFKTMNKLRFLILHASERGNIYLPSGLESLPDSLIYLFWWRCPLKSLPSTFCPEKLVEIRMGGSHVEKLWDGVQNLASLGVLDLVSSKHLLELPDLSKASNLEQIYLQYCASLVEVHPSILSLQKLEWMDLSECTSLKSFKTDVPMRSLRALFLTGCSSLREFSIMSTEMEYLDLRDTAIDELSSSLSQIKDIENLVFPAESRCKLPKSVGKLRLTGSRVKSDIPALHNVLKSLRDLEDLDLSNCTFSELPNNINQLKWLHTLSVGRSHVESLPANIKHLSHLTYLRLYDCMKLRSLPELPPSLLELDATNCTSLETVFTSTCDSETPRVHNEAFFFFENCIKLGEDVVNSIVADVHVRMKQANDLLSGRTLEDDHLCGSCSDKSGSQICFYLPGGKIPDWFSYCSTQPSLTIEIPSHSRFFGFAFCVIVAVAESDVETELWNLECECSFEADNGETIKFKSQFDVKFSHILASDHIYLWYDAHCYEQIVDAIKNTKNYNPKFLFEFFIETFDPGNGILKMSSSVVSNEMKGVMVKYMIKSCGVHPIYASKDSTIREERSAKSNGGLEIHELESLPKITRQVIPPPLSSRRWEEKESKGLKEILF